MSCDSKILVAVSDSRPTVAVKPIGVCKMGICQTLRRFVEQYEAPNKTDVYFDLSAVEFVDSTFTGFLLGLATKKNRPSAPDLHLVSPSAKALDTLRGMHLLPFFDICDKMPHPPGEWTVLAAEPVNADGAADLVIETHEQLVEADPRNADQFGRVVEVFRSERNRKRRTGDES